MSNERVFAMSFARVYPHYAAKAEKKGRMKEEIDEIFRWLTGYVWAGRSEPGVVATGFGSE